MENFKIIFLIFFQIKLKILNVILDKFVLFDYYILINLIFSRNSKFLIYAIIIIEIFKHFFGKDFLIILFNS